MPTLVLHAPGRRCGSAGAAEICRQDRAHCRQQLGAQRLEATSSRELPCVLFRGRSSGWISVIADEKRRSWVSYRLATRGRNLSVVVLHGDVQACLQAGTNST